MPSLSICANEMSTRIAVNLIWSRDFLGVMTVLIFVGAACSVVVKLLDLDPQGRWFDPWCGHDKMIRSAQLLGPLSKALNPSIAAGGMSPA